MIQKESCPKTCTDDDALDAKYGGTSQGPFAQGMRRISYPSVELSPPRTPVAHQDGALFS